MLGHADVSLQQRAGSCDVQIKTAEGSIFTLRPEGGTEGQDGGTLPHPSQGCIQVD